MNRGKVLFVAAAMFVLAAMLLAPIAAGQTEKSVLTPGDYTAKVRAIVCGGCGPLIKNTMQKMKGIEAVTVDQQKKEVQFTVKKDSTIKLAELQKALKAAADTMGMGANYELYELKELKRN